MAAKALSFDVGDYVVYPKHGVGRVIELQKEQIAGMVSHMENLMNDIDFFQRRNASRMMRRMQSLFARAGTETEDIDLLRGFFRTLQKKLNN